MFGEKNNKPICFWLKGLDLLMPTDIVEKDTDMVRWVHKATGKQKSCSRWYNTNTPTTADTDPKHSLELPRLWRNSGEAAMRDNIMFIPALVLAVAEIAALVVMVRGWVKDRRAEDGRNKMRV